MKKFALLATAVLMVGVPVAAQNASLRATYGSVGLTSGFTPDPYTVNLQAGGNINASSLPGACRGMIANAPDFELTYRSGSLPLAIRAYSNVDTTLVVNGPDGRWYCDDDSLGNANPQVYFSSPMSGVYDIWVGTYAGGVQPATLQITEVP